MRTWYGLSTTSLFVLSCLFFMPWPVAAQQGSEVGAAHPAARQAAITGQRPLYRVLDICSITGGTNQCATHVRVGNQGLKTCNIGVEFYPGATTTPSCTVTTMLGPGIRNNICSRGFASPESCSQTCNPELTFVSGYAIVYSSCVAISVQGDVFTHDSGGVITSARTVNTIFVGNPASLPGTKATQGD
jgi:hypothetical protein